MALMFNRIARNLAKNGFYPTDAVTTGRILHALQPANPGKSLRVLDPCCGEGIALRAIADHLSHSDVVTYGVEFDRDRSRAAKNHLDQVLWCDFQDTFIEASAFDLLFLNPPYGWLAADQAQTGREDINRFEELFFRRSLPSLAIGGVLVLILPVYELRAQMARWIAKSLSDVRVFMAPDQSFRQVVVFGVRRRAVQAGFEHIAQQLINIGEGTSQCEELPDEPWIDPYLVPSNFATSQKAPKFQTLEMDPLQLEDITRSERALWSTFDSLFRSSAHRGTPPPLRSVTEWHMALLLASGEVNGLIEGNDGALMLVKGHTTKEGSKTTSQEFNEEGDVTAVVTVTTERFKPTIRAVNLTQHSPTFGEILVIS